MIEREPHTRVQYIEVCHPETLEPMATLGETPALVAIAAYVGQTRLIDNLIVTPIEAPHRNTLGLPSRN